MSRTRALKEAFIFFALVIGITFFVFWGPLALFQVPTISYVADEPGPWWGVALLLIGGFVPSLAGLLLTGVREGKPGLREMGRRVIQFNIGWRWYLAAIAVVVIGTLGQITILRLFGRPFDLTAFLAQLGLLLPSFVIGPLSEELGWAGYAQDRLQTRWSPRRSAILLGVIWSFWHLPLFFIPGMLNHDMAWPFAAFLLGKTSLRVVYGWLHNNTGGSIWTAIFFHWLHTWAETVVIAGAVLTTLHFWMLSLPFFAIALVVLAVWKPKLRPAMDIAQA
jgi:membrane protease YdiL (CAAX protease family)